MTTLEKIKEEIYKKSVQMHFDGNFYIKMDEVLQILDKYADQEPCDDVIDRAEAMTEIMMFAGNVKLDEEDVCIKVSDAVQLLRELPSVTQKSETVTEFADRCRECGAKYGKLLKKEPKTWHWISHYDEDAKEGWYECDRCHTERAFNTDYCPDCGARMVEPRESEDKE